MADDEKAREMDAALALAGMGILSHVNMETEQPSTTAKASVPSRGGRLPKIKRGMMNQKQRGGAYMQTMSRVSAGINSSNGAFPMTPPVNVSEPTISDASEIANASYLQQDSAQSRKGVLRKIPKDVVVRSKLKTKIQRQGSGQDTSNQSSVDHSSSDMAPQRKRKKKDSSKQSKSPEGKAYLGNPTTQNTVGLGNGPVSRHVYAANTLHPPAIEEELRKKHGEFSSVTNINATSIPQHQSITTTHNLPRTIVLESGQYNSEQNMSPKMNPISTTLQANFTSVSEQLALYSRVGLLPQHYALPISNQLGILSQSVVPISKERPELKLTIPGQKQAQSLNSTYSPISPADNPIQAAYANIAPTVPTISQSDQSEPLDLSKDTTVKDEAEPSTSRRRCDSDSKPSSAGILMSPLRYLPPSVQGHNFSIKDGKLIIHDVDGGSEIIANPASIGIQVVTDPKSGQTLFIQNPNIQELERLNSNKSNGTARQSSMTEVENISTEVKTELKPEVKTEQHLDSNQDTQASPKAPRSQSTLPPKKRKFAEVWKSEEKQEDIPESKEAVSIAASIASSNDEGYGTLGDNFSASSASIPSPNATSPRRQTVAQTAYPDISQLTNVTLAPLGAPLTQKPVFSAVLPVSVPAVSKEMAMAAPQPQAFTYPTTVLRSQLGAMAMSLPANLEIKEDIPSSVVPTTKSPMPTQRESVSELYANKLFREYQRSVREYPNVQPSKSPFTHAREFQNLQAGKASFTHFRPARGIKRSNSKYDLNLNTGDEGRPGASKMKVQTRPIVTSAGATMLASDVRLVPVPPTTPIKVQESKMTVTESHVSVQSPSAVESRVGSVSVPAAILVAPASTASSLVNSAPVVTSAISPQTPIARAPSGHQVACNQLTVQETNAEQEETESHDRQIKEEEEEIEEVAEEPSAELRESCKRAGLADKDGDLPIHIAVVHENVHAVEKLLYMMNVAEINVDHLNNDRQTPLHLAVITKNQEILTLLLLSGSNPNLPDRKGYTGIHLAVKNNSRESLTTILNESTIQPDLNAKNYEGNTALHMAVIECNTDMVQTLLLAGASKDLQDNKSGRTALFHAAENKHFHIAGLLLKKGASVNIPSYAGTTPAQAANGRGHSELVALLIKYGADVSSTMREGDFTPRASTLQHHAPSSSSRAVKTAVKDKLKLKTRRRMRNGVKVGDTVVTSLQQAQSLDFEPLSMDSPVRDRKTAQSLTQLLAERMRAAQNAAAPLKIVLPDQGGVAASMPLSPSALGLATSKTRPMINPMHAKSLPDDYDINATNNRKDRTDQNAPKTPTFEPPAMSPKGSIVDAIKQSGLKRTFSENSLFTKPTTAGFALPDKPINRPSITENLANKMAAERNIVASALSGKQAYPPKLDLTRFTLIDGRYVPKSPVYPPYILKQNMNSSSNSSDSMPLHKSDSTLKLKLKLAPSSPTDVDPANVTKPMELKTGNEKSETTQTRPELPFHKNTKNILAVPLSEQCDTPKSVLDPEKPSNDDIDPGNESDNSIELSHSLCGSPDIRMGDDSETTKIDDLTQQSVLLDTAKGIMDTAGARINLDSSDVHLSQQMKSDKLSGQVVKETTSAQSEHDKSANTTSDTLKGTVDSKPGETIRSSPKQAEIQTKANSPQLVTGNSNHSSGLETNKQNTPMITHQNDDLKMSANVSRLEAASKDSSEIFNQELAGVIVSIPETPSDKNAHKLTAHPAIESILSGKDIKGAANETVVGSSKSHIKANKNAVLKRNVMVVPKNTSPGGGNVENVHLTDVRTNSKVATDKKETKASLSNVSSTADTVIAKVASQSITDYVRSKLKDTLTRSSSLHDIAGVAKRQGARETEFKSQESVSDSELDLPVDVLKQRSQKHGKNIFDIMGKSKVSKK